MNAKTCSIECSRENAIRARLKYKELGISNEYAREYYRIKYNYDKKFRKNKLLDSKIRKEVKRMKTNAKSVHGYHVDLWSKNYFVDKGQIQKPKGAYENMIFDGIVTNMKTKKKMFFKSPAKFLDAFEKMYKEDEKNTKK